MYRDTLYTRHHAKYMIFLFVFLGGGDVLFISSLSEWDVIEWSDDQAVFTFLYDTIELTITFDKPVGE